MITTRRTFSKALSLAGLGTAVIGLSGFSPWTLVDAYAQTPEEIAKPGPLGDIVLGSKDASVTIVEYASMTCPHCAAFTNNVFPKIKSDYIDTGKVKFIFREFPLDQVALSASTMARCVAKGDAEKYFAIIEILFKPTQQADLAGDARGTILRIGKQAGFSEQMIRSCVQEDQTVSQGILDGRKYAAETLKINGTPSFFINGTPLRGEQTFAEFEKLIKPMLKS